jgi:hypothetical protein
VAKITQRGIIRANTLQASRKSLSIAFAPRAAAQTPPPRNSRRDLVTMQKSSPLSRYVSTLPVTVPSVAVILVARQIPELCSPLLPNSGNTRDGSGKLARDRGEKTGPSRPAAGHLPWIRNSVMRTADREDSSAEQRIEPFEIYLLSLYF